MKKIVTGIALALTSYSVMAAPFGDYDARSAGMGGVGVVTSSLGSSPHFNPAMLAVQKEEVDFELLVNAGFRGRDPQKLLDDIENFQFEVNFGSPANALAIFNSTSGKSVATAEHYGVSAGVNGETIKGALIYQNSLHTGYQTTGTTVANAELEARGLDVTDIGIAGAMNFGPLSIGLVPKIQQVKTYTYGTSLQTVDSDMLDLSMDAGERDNGDNFNLDAGAVYNFENGFLAGITLRNTLEQSYTTSDNVTIKVKPQLRAGVGYISDYFTIAVDLDLTSNDPVGFEQKTQYFLLGAELNAWDWLHLRAGYRKNQASGVNDNDVITLGAGFKLFGAFGLDAAVVTEQDDYSVFASIVGKF